MIRLVPIFFLILVTQIEAQTSFNREFTSYGRGASTTMNGETNCLNINPSMLAIEDTNYLATISFADWQLEVQSLAADVLIDLGKSLFEEYGTSNNSVLPEYFNYIDFLYGDYDTSYSLSDRALELDKLRQPVGGNYNFQKLGVYFKWKDFGNIAIRINEEFNSFGQLSEELSELVAYGPISQQFDSLVLQDGKIIPNDSIYYNNDVLSQIFTGYANNPKTFSELANGTNLQFSRYKTLSIGWGKRYGNLLLGGNLNLHRGMNYFSFQTNDNGITMINSDPHPITKDAGKGASVSLGITYLHNEKLKIGASLNNLGCIRWGYRKFDDNNWWGNTAVYQNDSILNNFQLGTSTTIDFYDQWSELRFKTTDFSSKTDFERIIWTPIPARFNLGASYVLGKVIEIGGDVTLPIIRNTINTEGGRASFGVQFNTKVITLRSGFTYDSYFKTRLPIGLSFGGKKSKFEMGGSFSDLLLINNKANHTNKLLGVSGGLKIRI